MNRERAAQLAEKHVMELEQKVLCNIKSNNLHKNRKWEKYFGLFSI